MISSKTIYDYGKTVVGHVWCVGKIYIVWIYIYYIAAISYSHLCAPATLWGLLTAPFLVPLPHCVALRWCIQHGSEVITAMWLVLGSWFVVGLTGILSNNNN